MAKYKVNVTEKNFGIVTVEAGSPGEAIDLAENAYADGNVEWGKTDFQVGNAEEVKV